MPRAAERRDGSAALSPVLRVSLAGILSTMADAVDESAFESLVDVFECYVRTIGSVGSQAAQHAGRTHANLSDALLGLSAVGAGPIAALRDLQRVAPDLGPAGHDALPQHASPSTIFPNHAGHHVAGRRGPRRRGPSTPARAPARGAFAAPARRGAAARRHTKSATSGTPRGPGPLAPRARVRETRERRERDGDLFPGAR